MIRKKEFSDANDGMSDGFNHVFKIIAFGVYFGYSEDSIVQFLEEFHLAGRPENTMWNYKERLTKRFVVGFVCSSKEIETLTKDEMINEVELNRYEIETMPNESDDIFGIVHELYKNNDGFYNNVNYIFNKCINNKNIKILNNG